MHKVYSFLYYNPTNPTEHPMDWNVDHNTEGVEKFLNWVKEMGGCFVQVLTAATTEEGRQVLVIKVTDPFSDEPKTKIWIEAGKREELVRPE